MSELFPPDVYPLSGVAPLTPGQRLSGQGFYPGCAGFVGPRPPDSVGGVIFVAHNYSSVQTFEESDIPRGGDDPNRGTLGPLKDLLSRVPIPLERCWFTNGFMGLKNDPNKSSAVGKFPPEVYKHRPYMDANQQFLQVEVEVMKPRVVVFLGDDALRVSDRIAPAWRNHRSVRDLDQRKIALVVGKPVVVALVHPAFRHVNKLRRVYGEYRGDSAEVALLREALRLSGFAAAA